MKDKCLVLRQAVGFLSGYNYYGFGASLGVCEERLADFVKLPEPHPKQLRAVFTEKPNASSFKLVLPRGDRWSAKLEGVREYIVSSTRAQLREMYDLGYRYVHLEHGKPRRRIRKVKRS